MNGIYQHCSKRHLERYLCEYDFRYNHHEKLGFDDIARTDMALRGIAGKRLLYKELTRNKKYLSFEAYKRTIEELRRTEYMWWLEDNYPDQLKEQKWAIYAQKAP